MDVTDIIATWLAERHLADPDATCGSLRAEAERINASDAGWTFHTPAEQPGWTVRHERYYFSAAQLETIIAAAERYVGEAPHPAGEGDGAYGTLYDYDTAEALRAATEDELRASREAAKHDGGAGVIVVGMRGVYVTGEVTKGHTT